MNAIFDSRAILRNLTCALAALLITVAMVCTFLNTTIEDRSAGATLTLASLKIPLDHKVFGRPEPAVLVD